MKNLIRRVFIFLLFAAFIPSCSLFEDCKTCKLVTDDGTNITKGTGIPTCGDKLAEREAEDPTTIGNTTTYWECE
jgi:hypothetical protein